MIQHASILPLWNADEIRFLTLESRMPYTPVIPMIYPFYLRDFSQHISLQYKQGNIEKLVSVLRKPFPRK